MVYFDDGRFRLRTFGRMTRTESAIRADEVELNELVGINDWSMAI